MDHLPQLDESSVPVPFCAQLTIYQPDQFFDLPEKYGSIDNLLRGGPDIIPAEEVAPFLQSWLFFSLLSQVLDVPIDAHEFYRENHLGSPEVNTERLDNHLSSWKSREILFDISDDNRIRRRIRAGLALDEARTFVLKWCSDNTYNHTPLEDQKQLFGPAQKPGELKTTVDPLLCLSFAILGETLDRARPRIKEPGPIQYWDMLNVEQRSWGFSEYLKDRMLGAGWCPRDIRRIKMTMGDLSSIYYASSFKPTRQVDHSKCSIQECLKMPINKSPQHTVEGCTCQCETPDAREITRILQDGNIPLLRYTAGGKLRIEIYRLRDIEKFDSYRRESITSASTSSFEDCTYTPDNSVSMARTPFAAISHAWSDGLGYNDGKGLPKCQLDRLRKALNSNHETVDLAFWIDSLCIPKLYEDRKLAIQKMGEVYKRAFTVLVLDSGLLNTSSKNNSLEATVRINTGVWTQRLWTLQEGILAKNLHFNFKDGLLSTQELLDRYRRAKMNPMDKYHHVYKAGWLFSPSVHNLKVQKDQQMQQKKKQDHSEDHRVAEVWQAMQWRSADRKSDETFCLATLLEMNPLTLLNIRPSGVGDLEVSALRMVEFLSMLDKQVGIPPGMIFMPGPRLSREGFSWAPRSWMTEQQRTYPSPLFPTVPGIAFLTQRGLHVQYPGVRLHPPKVQVKDRFWLPVSRSLHTWYKVKYLPEVFEEHSWQDIWERACSGNHLPAIILSQFEPTEDLQIAILVKSIDRRVQLQHVPGKVNWATEDVCWVQILCRLHVRLETNHQVIKGQVTNFRKNVNEMMWADLLEPEQRWCVDGYTWDD